VREVARDKIVAAAIGLLRPDLEAAYYCITGDAPDWFERLIAKCEDDADIIAGNVGIEAIDAHAVAQVKAVSEAQRDAQREAEHEAYHEAYIPAFAEAFPRLLKKALAKHDADLSAG
jgi:hypothetical protein